MRTKFQQPVWGIALAILFFCNFTASAFYDPHIGRWINRDPMGEQGGRNLYSFVRNAPTMAIDINGLFEISVHKKIVDDGFRKESFTPLLQPRSYGGLLGGLKDGVEWNDLPGHLWEAIDVFGPNKTLVDNPNTNSIWYKTHFGEFQYWHSMQYNEANADELLKKIKAWVSDQSKKGRKLYEECKYKESGLEIGKALHTIQDSFSRSHVIRDARTWEIIQFENYTAQNPKMHEHADEDTKPNVPNINAATRTTKSFLEIVYATKYDESKVQNFLDAIYRVRPGGAIVGGTDPAYKK